MATNKLFSWNIAGQHQIHHQYRLMQFRCKFQLFSFFSRVITVLSLWISWLYFLRAYETLFFDLCWCVVFTQASVGQCCFNRRPMHDQNVSLTLKTKRPRINSQTRLDQKPVFKMFWVSLAFTHAHLCWSLLPQRYGLFIESLTAQEFSLKCTHERFVVRER